MFGPYDIDIIDKRLSPDPYINEDTPVKEVWSGKKWHSSIRKDYQRGVCVMWEDNTKTIEPVCNLIDFVNKEICEKMIPVLCNWKISVETNVCNTKLCAFCNQDRQFNNFVCKECEDKTEWLNTFINKELIIRENVHISNSNLNNFIPISPSPNLIKFPETLIKKRKYEDFEENLDKILMDISL